MTTVLVAAKRLPGIMSKFDLSTAFFPLCALTRLLSTYSKPIADRLGESPMAVVARVMGMLAAALHGVVPVVA